MQASLSTAPNGSRCVANIKNATQELQHLADGSDDGDAMKLSTLFNLCSYDDSPASKDKANLFATLASSFDEVVQYNADNRDFENRVIPTLALAALPCGRLTCFAGVMILTSSVVSQAPPSPPKPTIGSICAVINDLPPSGRVLETYQAAQIEMTGQGTSYFFGSKSYFSYSQEDSPLKKTDFCLFQTDFALEKEED